MRLVAQTIATLINNLPQRSHRVLCYCSISYCDGAYW